MDAEQALATAQSHIEAIQAAADHHHTQLAELEANRDVSEDYRSRTRAELTRQYTDNWANFYRATTDLLDATTKAAETALRTTPSDPGALARVSGALATMPPAAIADVCVEMGDIEALRALRSAIPMHVATQVRDPLQRQRTTTDLLHAVDERIAAIGAPAEAAAVRARAGIEATRAHLESVTSFASNPSAARRLNLAYASAR